MNYLIVDLEATCNIVNQQDEMETIEIGAVLCDETGDVIDTFDTFVKPIVNPILSDFCKELTTIRQEDVDNAPFFKAAMLSLLAWLGDKKYVFCSWGYYDKQQLLLDCARHGIVFPLGTKHYNLKNEYARLTGKGRHGISNTIKALGWEWEGQLHRGIDDAKNMARVFKLIAGSLNATQK